MKKLAMLVFGLLFIALSAFSVIEDDKHIGLWKGVDATQSIGYINLDKEDYAFFVIEKDTLGGKSFMMQGVEGYMKYEVDYESSPHGIDFVIYLAENDTELGRLPGIFKFEEGTMVLCVNFESPARPTEFVEDSTITLEKQEEAKE